jgi:4-amino-4-deoxy-L-arabinose transferase-like glycosyltransferase
VRTSWIRVAVLILCWAIVVLPGLFVRDLWPPDEIRFAEVAREMAATGEYFLPHLNGAVYGEKPPLFFWLTALLSVFLGWGEVASRLVAGLAALATLLLTYALGRRMFSPQKGGGDSAPPYTEPERLSLPVGQASAHASIAAFLGSLALLTSFLFLALAQIGLLDMLLTCWTTLALYAYWRSQESEGRSAPHASRLTPLDRPPPPCSSPLEGGRGMEGGEKKASRLTPNSWLLLFYAAMGLAVLTKGPVGFVIPALVVLAFSFWREGVRGWRAIHPLWGVPLLLVLVGLWLVPALVKGGSEYAELVLWKQQAARITQAWNPDPGTFQSHTSPWYFYLAVFPLSFLPWVFFLPLTFLWAWRKRQEAGLRFLLVWVGGVFLFFNLLSGKQPHYLLPLFPALALLTGGALAERRLRVEARGSRQSVLFPVGQATAPAPNMTGGDGAPPYVSPHEDRAWMMGKGWRWTLGVLLGLTVLLGLGLAGGSAALPRIFSHFLEIKPEQTLSWLPLMEWPNRVFLFLVGLGLLVFGVGLIRRLHRLTGYAVGAAVTAAVLAVHLAAALWVLPQVNNVKSIRPLGEALRARLQPEDRVLLYGQAFHGIINYYLGKDRLPVVPDPRAAWAPRAEGGRTFVVLRRSELPAWRGMPYRPIVPGLAGDKQLVAIELIREEW